MSNKNAKKRTPAVSVSRKVRARMDASHKPKLNGIQIAGIAVIVLVVALLAWAIIVNLPKPAAAAPTPTPDMLATLLAESGYPTAALPVETQPANSNAKQYASAPPMQIDLQKDWSATVKMAQGGEFVIQLYPDKAPITVNSFVFLAREGFFDGVTFHRVLEGFMAQTGDPTGTGMGGPGYKFQNEDSDLTFDKAGVVAMANSGRDTNGSQFFITFGPTPHLNGGYTIFGQVISGMDVVNKITLRDPDTNPTFTGDVIETITITEK